MNLLFSKILAILLLFSGEALAIFAEMIAAKTITSSLFLQIFLKTFLIIILAGGLLLTGYMLGFKTFKNIWIVSIVSITSILIIEPFLAYTIFRQLPTKGAIIGFILGVLGFIFTIFF